MGMGKMEPNCSRLGRRWQDDPETGLPLPLPYPEYLTCPYCGEPEVEAWCFEQFVVCHNCGSYIPHIPTLGCGQCLPRLRYPGIIS